MWCLGYPDQALESSQDARSLAQELSHSTSVVAAHTMAAMVCQCRGEVKLVQQQTEAVTTQRSELTHPFLPWLAVLRGWALAEEGRVEEGLAQLLRGMADWRAVGVEVQRPNFLTLLAHVHLRHGQVERGLEALEEARALTDATGEGLAEAEVYRLQGELMLMRERVDDPAAEACFRQALEVARRQKAKSYELRAVMSLSRLLSKHGQHEKARSMVAEVYGWFTEGFGTRDLRDARQMLEWMSG